VDAGNRATRGAGFLGEELAMALFVSIFRERDAWVAALLGAIVDQAVLADVEVARTRAATPVVLAASGDIVLELVDAGERAFAERHDLLEDFLFAGTERLELAVTVVENANSGGEAEFDGAVGDSKRVFRIANAAAEDRINVDVKLGMLGQKLEFLVEDFEAFFRDVVGLDVVNADLEIFETGTIQTLDPVGDEKIAVGDQAGHDSVVADAGDDGIELGMQQGLAAADGDDGGAHGTEAIDAAEHFVRGDRLREIVEFVAISAGKIAAADGNDVREERVSGGDEALGEHAEFAQLAVRGADFSANFGCGCNRHWIRRKRLLRCTDCPGLFVIMPYVAAFLRGVRKRLRSGLAREVKC
jgi:hypothetical protein